MASGARMSKRLRGISKSRMLVILGAAIKEGEASRQVSRPYIEALVAAEAILLGEIPLHNEEFWRPIIAKSDKRSHGGFAAMSPERLREVSAHGKGNFKRRQNAIEAGQKGALARLANSTPEQRREWASLGAKAVNEKRSRSS